MGRPTLRGLRTGLHSRSGASCTRSCGAAGKDDSQHRAGLPLSNRARPWGPESQCQGTPCQYSVRRSHTHPTRQRRRSVLIQTGALLSLRCIRALVSRLPTGSAGWNGPGYATDILDDPGAPGVGHVRPAGGALSQMREVALEQPTMPGTTASPRPTAHPQPRRWKQPQQPRPQTTCWLLRDSSWAG